MAVGVAGKRERAAFSKQRRKAKLELTTVEDFGLHETSPSRCALQAVCQWHRCGKAANNERY
jgi:hypothetical protein